MALICFVSNCWLPKFFFRALCCALGGNLLGDNWGHKKANKMLTQNWEGHLGERAMWLKGEERKWNKKVTLG